MQEAVRAFVVDILKSLQALLPSAVVYPALASLARKGQSLTTPACPSFVHNLWLEHALQYHGCSCFKIVQAVQ